MSFSDLTCRHARPIIAVMLFFASVVSLTATEKDIGLTWDESEYIVAGYVYANWFPLLISEPGKAFSSETIEQSWNFNHFHPPVSKVVSGLVSKAARPMLSGTPAARLGNILLNSLLVAFLFMLVSSQMGILTGLAAALFMQTLPRYFFHAHLSTLDVPVASLMVVTLTLFWLWRHNRGIGYDIGLGALFGIAVGAKINAAFILPALALWVLICYRERYMGRRLVLMGAVGMATWFAIWPWLYYDTVARVAEFIGLMTVDHPNIGQWYLGAFHKPPPWHFPWVMLAAVVPLVPLLLAIGGIVSTLVSPEKCAFGLFLLINCLVPLCILSLGLTVVYDNERLFIPAFPFLMAFAGIGLVGLIRFAHQKISPFLSNSAATRLKPALAAIIVAIAFVPHLTAAASLYPHLLSYYSGAIGGLAGATRLGFETTYWGETYQHAIPYLNEHAKPGDTVWIEDWSQQIYFAYQFFGELRDDVRLAMSYEVPSHFAPQQASTVVRDYRQADFVVFQHRQTQFSEQGMEHPLRKWLQEQEPAMTIERDGVTLLAIYRNKSAPETETSDDGYSMVTPPSTGR